MKLSAYRRDCLYNALSDPVMDLRIWIQLHPDEICKDTLDRKLYELELTQWERVRKTLNIDE